VASISDLNYNNPIKLMESSI